MRDVYYVPQLYTVVYEVSLWCIRDTSFFDKDIGRKERSDFSEVNVVEKEMQIASD